MEAIRDPDNIEAALRAVVRTRVPMRRRDDRSALGRTCCRPFALAADIICGWIGRLRPQRRFNFRQSFGQNRAFEPKHCVLGLAVMPSPEPVSSDGPIDTYSAVACQ